MRLLNSRISIMICKAFNKPGIFVTVAYSIFAEQIEDPWYVTKNETFLFCQEHCITFFKKSKILGLIHNCITLN
jgi:hypothetical protein